MRGMRGVGTLIVVLVLAAVALLQRSDESRQTPGVPPPTAAPSSPATPSVGFRSAGLLNDHFEKHGQEFGSISRAEYLARAQRLRDRPAEGDVLELRRSDGVITRFDRATGDFLAFDADLTIRTFFRPNDGERYFRRQAARRGGGE
ncbi:MAG TPA: hypothetical protein VFT04_13970 [Gemmatimonadales bacterium]|nr:hypothetical protein [Gemmatimonadales bacterium]